MRQTCRPPRPLHATSRGVSSSPNVSAKVSQAEQRLSEGNLDECLTNLRLALKFALDEAAGDVTARENITVVPSEEHQVREFLEKKGFFTKEERCGYSGIHGLLSKGPHGTPDEETTLLAFAASLMAFRYLSVKLQRYRSLQPRIEIRRALLLLPKGPTEPVRGRRHPAFPIGTCIITGDFGGRHETRTRDLLVANEALFQLS